MVGGAVVVVVVVTVVSVAVSVGGVVDVRRESSRPQPLWRTLVVSIRSPLVLNSGGRCIYNPCAYFPSFLPPAPPPSSRFHLLALDVELHAVKKLLLLLGNLSLRLAAEPPASEDEQRTAEAADN